MDSNLNPSVISEIVIAGAKFQIVDYHWSAGTEISECDPDVILRWRMRPHRIKARAWIRPGEELSFGQLMLHPAGVITHGHASDGEEDVRTLVCSFEREWLASVTDSLDDLRERNLSPCLDLRNGDLDHAMRRLTRELLNPGFASHTVAEGLGMTMAADVMRFFGVAGGPILENRGVLSAGRLRQVHDYIMSVEEGCPTLADVAKQCGVSIAHLRRMYKSTTSQTLHDYIEETRVTRAKTLLLDTILPLKVISYKLGFCHPSAFSFAFKKMTGESPREFRNRCATGTTLAH